MIYWILIKYYELSTVNYRKPVIHCDLILSMKSMQLGENTHNIIYLQPKCYVNHIMHISIQLNKNKYTQV